MTIYALNSSNHSPEGSIALRNFFNELFIERALTNSSEDDGGDSSDSHSDSDNVSLSSDEETTASQQSTMAKIDELGSTSHHTRRRRFRKSRGAKLQRPKFAVSPDNAAGVRRGSSKTEQLMVSSYHNPLNKSSSHGKNRLSVSAHSLGSRTGISSASVDNWRSRQQFQKQRQMARKNHRDSRWSTAGPQEIPNNSRSSRVKSYDFGFVNDSLHVRSELRRKKNNRPGMRGNLKAGSNSRKGGFSFANSCTRAIDSAVRVVNSSSDSDEDYSSGGEEFFEDDVESLSSVTNSFATNSRGGNTTIGSSTMGSSLDFGARYKTKAKALPTRVVPSRTKSGGDLPRLPRRTRDDSSFKSAETFEPLKGSTHSGKKFGGFQKAKMRRSVSDDVSLTAAAAKQQPKINDLFGRWAATVTKSKADSSSSDCVAMPAPPRRIPSLSGRSERSETESTHKIKKVSSRSTGRYSNHSNDSSEPSDSESDDDADFHNSFAYDDDSLTATMATTGSSATYSGGSSSVSFEKDNKLKMLSGHHSHGLSMAIPESLRKLPHHSFHEDSTISSKMALNGRRRHPGKSLRTTARPW